MKQPLGIISFLVIGYNAAAQTTTQYDELTTKAATLYQNKNY
jgi:hypothetical protein